MRKQWNLNGMWGFEIDPKNVGEKDRWHIKGLPAARSVDVPHIWQREGGQYLHYNGAAWYSRGFSACKQESKRLILHFDAVDYHTRVWINGNYAGEHEGGFTPFEFDITDLLSPEGENTLAVRVYDPQDNAEIPIGKQGSWYTRVSGIWQSVFLEERAQLYVQDVRITPVVDEQKAHVRVELNTTPCGQEKVHYVVKDHVDPKGELNSGEFNLEGSVVEFIVDMPEAILWEPDHPHLYELTIAIEGLDQSSSTFGMRKVEHRDGLVCLNGKPIYLRGALDQAFYPDTVYVAPSDEYIQNEIRLAKEMGFNLLRKHIKVEIPRYLYWADRMGMLIWAEPPNYVKWTPQGQNRFKKDLTAMIRRDYNHPSILIWSIYNEEWGLEWDLAKDPAKQTHVEELYQEVKELDSTRLVCDNSGWTHVKTDINDHHRYFVCPDQLDAWKKDLDEFVLGNPDQNFVGGRKSNGEPIIISEFGIWGLPSIEKLKQHYGGEPWWFVNQGEESHQEDYKKPTTAEANFSKFGLDRIFPTFEELAVSSQTRMFRAVKSVVEEMRKRPAIAGYVVTEFTDIEWETNGWLDYMRNPKEGFENLKDFNGPLTVMVDGVNHNVWCEQNFQGDIILSNHDLKAFEGTIEWRIAGTGLSGQIPVTVQGEVHIHLQKAISFKVPTVEAPGFYELHVSLLVNGDIWAKNSEELTISPMVINGKEGLTLVPYQMPESFVQQLRAQGCTIGESFDKETVVVTNCLDEAVLAFAREGGHVLFMAEQGDQLTSKGQYTFRHLPEGESWPRASSFNYVNPNEFPGIPLLPEMGWEVDELIPHYVVPFHDYKIAGGRRAIHLFGNPGLAESCEIISGYFQGWIGQVGGSILRHHYGEGSITLTTWRLTEHYGIHPIATQVVHQLMKISLRQQQSSGAEEVRLA
ncbi:glycoside hydrolase family 2 protein [Ammoniphilus sp. YIM 78166]|uniref:glycoside hydrolase family 2 protein n=1 Tax=Ammoniphilus sp. YIM 78166 TaxID=1644106 RepID=UPI0014322563|nr:sugar-binding domain-containing protein [Ammoniphilus sp. YIM 78166]